MVLQAPDSWQFRLTETPTGDARRIGDLWLETGPGLPVAGTSLDVGMAVEAHVAQLLSEHEPDLPPAGLYQRVLDKVEAPLIAMALNACGGNQIRAADLLGLNRNTLRKKIRAHAIEIVKQSRRQG